MRPRSQVLPGLRSCPAASAQAEPQASQGGHGLTCALPILTTPCTCALPILTTSCRVLHVPGRRDNVCLSRMTIFLVWLRWATRAERCVCGEGCSYSWDENSCCLPLHACLHYNQPLWRSGRGMSWKWVKLRTSYPVYHYLGFQLFHGSLNSGQFMKI